MACELCTRSSHCCQSFNHLPRFDVPHYSDLPSPSEDVEDEPAAPTLSLGNRILWLTESRAASGIVGWIGRIPVICTGWTAGVEFDNVIAGGSNGDFRGRVYFHSRPGHALFLPVSDLIKVDDDDTGQGNGDRTSFFGRLQESCSNFAHRRRRDSTFGHFKQDYCSNCARNEFPYYSHYCNHVPVYDRITSRRSLCYDDHPYEVYNACVPCNSIPSTSHVQEGSICKRFVHDEQLRPCVVDHCSKISSLNRAARFNCAEYPEEEYSRITMIPKDSLFNPRSSISLISGFKEWVSCLVLGTNRKRKNKFIFKDRKSVTSVFLSRNSHSLTGQRLSSFSDYASVNLCAAAKKSTLTKSIVSKELEKSIETDSQTLPSMKKIVDTRQSFPRKPRSRKKRPAPLPPTQNVENVNHIKTQQDVNIPKKGQNIDREVGVKGDVVKEKEILYRIVRTNSFRAVPVRRKRKKRRAPLPPLVHNKINAENINSASFGAGKDENNLQKISAGRSQYIGQRQSKSSYDKLVLDQEKHGNASSSVKLKKVKHKDLRLLKNAHVSPSAGNDSLDESGTDELKNSSNSVSFSEEDSEEEKYGLVKYGMIKRVNSSEKDVNLSGSSNFMQYASDNSDVCLKISIKKTETNVVTVEEVPTSRTVQYTIEEDSSSSELSDEPVNANMKQKAITHKTEESKPNSTDSSSVSTDEINDKPKTIFEELELNPPVKRSVKDFVNAFNMLANKSSNEADRRGKQSSFKQLEPNKSNITASNGMKSNDKSIQSFPTKWEYQTNNLFFPSNKFLLPIAEESHNETSEHDGNLSVDDSNASSSQITKVRNKNNGSKDAVKSNETTEINQNCDKKCSHCSENHVHASNVNENLYKSVKKKTVPKKEKSVIYESFKPMKKNSPSTQASLAALSSLLQEKTGSGIQEDKTGNLNPSSKHNAKLDQPIMVGLYIEDKSSHRGPIPLLVTPSMSLRKLKKQIEKEYEFPRHQQCWILGESFAVADEASLASYGVTEPGCPVLLYVMAKESKTHSLPSRTSSHFKSKLVKNVSDSSDEEIEISPRRYKKNNYKLKQKPQLDINDLETQVSKNSLSRTDKTNHSNLRKAPPRSLHHKQMNAVQKKAKSEFHKAWEAEFEKKADYHTLLALDDVDLVANMEEFECPICFLDVKPGEGVTLQECLHSFCRECLAGAVHFSETAAIKCPFRNDEYSCESHLLEREIKSLVTPEIYERHLQKSMALAESQALDSFHCKTPDCPGWCLFEDNVNTFLCPVCKHTNCLTCAAIHEGKNCRQYQDDVAFRCDSSEEAKKTKEYLQNMVDNGEAMRCPQCQVILMKKWGCDWLKCSMCHTEVCWVTKGPRWGPGGRGDTSGGCKCMVDGVRCHPKCSYCH